MKRIYLLFAMLLGFFTPVFAQDDAFDFEGKTIEISGAVASFETNTWYFLYQGRGDGQGAGSYPILTTGQIPGEQGDKGGLMTDMGIEETVLKIDYNNVYGSGKPATENAKYLIRFIPNEDTEGTYYIQFGTGRYLSSPSKKENSATFTTEKSIDDAGTFFVYSIEAEPVGHFALHVNDDHLGLFDNNGTGNGIVTWGTGPKTDVGGNSVWSIHEVKWGVVDEYEAAYQALEDLYLEYRDKYMDTSGETPQATFPVGTQPGQYDAEAVAAFVVAMDAASAIGDPMAVFTLDELLTLAANLKSALEAVLESRVPFAFTLPDGYYRIRGAMKYTNTVEVYNPDTEQNESQEMQVDKYMYSILENGKIYARWNTPEDLTTDCASLWRITNKDGYYDVVNMATDGRFNNVARSAAVTMSTDSENLMAFDAAAYTEEFGYFINIRVSTQAGADGLYLHQNNHGGGTGKASNIVGWYSTYDAEAKAPKASEWVFDPVSDEEAAAIIEAYAPIKDHELLVTMYHELKDEAAAAIEAAKDVQAVQLLTDNSQLSSPWTDPEEGAITSLLDENTSTFWHSSWHDNPPHAVQGSHYIQVELPDGYYSDGMEAAFQFTRRAVKNDHNSKWSVRGTNENLQTDLENPLVDKEQCEELLVADTPLGSNTETLTSPSFDPKGYKYLRFYSEQQAGSEANNRVYWHMSEFRVFYQIENPNSQYSKMGQVAIDLDNLLKAQAGIEDADLEPTDYQALLAAYEAFMGAFVDPAELRAVIDSVKNIPSTVVVGEGIGYWPDMSTAEALQGVIDAATDYDTAGKYTAAQSDAYIADLREKAAAIPAAAKSIQTGKWYRIQFPSEEMFELYGWDPVAGIGKDIDDKPITEATDPSNIKTENLWGKYAAIAEFSYDEQGRELHEAPEGTVTLGHNVYFDDDDDIEDEGMAQFRFVAVGDSAYALQNRATGMFVKAAGTSGAVKLSVHPSLFNVRAIGYGLNAIAAKNLFGEAESYLHAQVSGNTLVTWNVSEPGTRSALLIEEVEDVDASYEGTTFNIGLRIGEIGAYCFATDITTGANIFGVTGVEVSDESVQITLVPINGAVNAGRPFILINGIDQAEDYDAEDDPEPIAFQHNYQFVATPAQDDSFLKGTYYAIGQIGKGVIIAKGNKLAVSKKEGDGVSANGAYIALEGDEKFESGSTVTYVIDAGEDGIAAALANVAKTGEIYSLDGRLISRKANLSTLRKLGRGVYILNGTKVTVK